jgi:hypothetical protein
MLSGTFVEPCCDTTDTYINTKNSAQSELRTFITEARIKIEIRRKIMKIRLLSVIYEVCQKISAISMDLTE